jgi:hypothetical protein
MSKTLKIYIFNIYVYKFLSLMLVYNIVVTESK